jgi:hypothetical protein
MDPTHRTTGGVSVPVTSTSGHVGTSHAQAGGGAQGVGGSSRGGKSELKETLGEGGEQLVQQAKQTGAQIYHAACEACHNWRHYPKLLTTALLLTSFLLGAGSMGLVTKTGLMGGSGNYIAAHWDRNTADAHHALDVILDHLQHPEMYEHKTSRGMVQKARNKISNFMEGILPESWSHKARRGMKDYLDTDKYSSRGGVTGMYDTISDKLSNVIPGMESGVGYGVKRGMEQVKDTGYGITDKMSDLASSLKHKFTPDMDTEDYMESAKRSMGMRGGSKRGSWVGGDEGDDDELNEATQHLRRVVRKAERDL